MNNFTPLNLNKFKSAEKSPPPPSPATTHAIVKRPSYLPQAVFTVALFLTLGLSAFLFHQNNVAQKLLTQATFDNSKPLIELIGRLVVLPTEETPTIATVTDEGQLPDQFLFKNAENGDKILVYTKARKAILYRPALNKIVEMGPLATQEESNADVSGAATPSAIIKTSTTPTREPKVIFNPVTATPSPTEIILNSTQTPTPTP